MFANINIAMYQVALLSKQCSIMPKQWLIKCTWYCHTIFVWCFTEYYVTFRRKLIAYGNILRTAYWKCRLIDHLIFKDCVLDFYSKTIIINLSNNSKSFLKMIRNTVLRFDIVHVYPLISSHKWCKQALNYL